MFGPKHANDKMIVPMLLVMTALPLGAVAKTYETVSNRFENKSLGKAFGLAAAGVVATAVSPLIIGLVAATSIASVASDISQNRQKRVSSLTRQRI